MADFSVRNRRLLAPGAGASAPFTVGVMEDDVGWHVLLNSAAFLDDLNAVAIELGSCNQASPQGKRIDFGA
jgi:hypothetical protein